MFKKSGGIDTSAKGDSVPAITLLKNIAKTAQFPGV
jgi:hypothetical protein